MGRGTPAQSRRKHPTTSIKRFVLAERVGRQSCYWPYANPKGPLVEIGHAAGKLLVVHDASKMPKASRRLSHIDRIIGWAACMSVTTSASSAIRSSSVSRWPWGAHRSINAERTSAHLATQNQQYAIMKARDSYCPTVPPLERESATPTDRTRRTFCTSPFLNHSDLGYSTRRCDKA